ncbi:hypothetical protein FNH07_26580 [Amycolatopsis bartoniae]|nr:hypothetical protein FNH07_26580 [Amycolatopsis bartoniae]
MTPSWSPPDPAEFLASADRVTTKREADLGNSVPPQLVLAQLMESGELERLLMPTGRRGWFSVTRRARRQTWKRE